MKNEGDPLFLKTIKATVGGGEPLKLPKAWGTSAQRSVLSSQTVENNHGRRHWAEPNPCGEDSLYFWSKHRGQEATSTDLFFI